MKDREIKNKGCTIGQSKPPPCRQGGPRLSLGALGSTPAPSPSLHKVEWHKAGILSCCHNTDTAGVCSSKLVSRPSCGCERCVQPLPRQLGRWEPTRCPHPPDGKRETAQVGDEGGLRPRKEKRPGALQRVPEHENGCSRGKLGERTRETQTRTRARCEQDHHNPEGDTG